MPKGSFSGNDKTAKTTALKKSKLAGAEEEIARMQATLKSENKMTSVVFCQNRNIATKPSASNWKCKSFSSGRSRSCKIKLSGPNLDQQNKNCDHESRKSSFENNSETCFKIDLAVKKYTFRGLENGKLLGTLELTMLLSYRTIRQAH